MEAIIRWHPFADGNKRTALLAVSAYLTVNGYVLLLPLSAVRFSVMIAREQKTDDKTNRKLIKDIGKWIEKYSARKEDTKRIEKIGKRISRDYLLLLYFNKSDLLAWLSRWVVKNWLAVDIYPEYEKELGDITKFLMYMIEINLSQVHKRLHDEKSS